jgi:hypothetical protein
MFYNELRISVTSCCALKDIGVVMNPQQKETRQFSPGTHKARLAGRRGD